MSIVKRIRPLEGFSNASDAAVVSRGTAVVIHMTSNPNFPNPPVDLAVLKADIEKLSALMAESLDGSRKVIAEKNRQREAVINKLRLLGRYVEVACNADMAIFQTSGFEPASTTKLQSAPLSEKIRKIEHGTNTGELVLWLKAIAQAYVYEIRYAALGSSGSPGEWTKETAVTVRPPVTLKGLTPGVGYVFQARWLGKSGYSDWSDSVSFMCT